MRSRLAGFTLVELLITIVVIGILASISVVAYSGIQKRAYNTSQIADVRNAIEALEYYRAKNNNQYPNVPVNTGYCIGTGYPNGKCRDSLAAANFYLESNRAVTNALGTYVAMPDKKRTLVNGSSGPFVYVYSATSYRVIGVFYGETCPNGFTLNWNDTSSDRLFCNKDLVAT